ncbi:hypothetical protein [Streptomyces sp. NPDC048425]|uniref:hypothetical protein n=1 Tax=Streptomyces sp. NPDC048425 TaxID=3365548 RepID=UPI0037229FCD
MKAHVASSASTLPISVVVSMAVALAVGYLLGRLCPWRRLGDWVADQVRFFGAWVRGSEVVPGMHRTGDLPAVPAIVSD